MSEEAAPEARIEGLLLNEIAGEMLIYDTTQHQAFCLNRSASLVWRGCNGTTGVADLARRVEAEMHVEPGEDVVRYALDELGKARLLKRGPAASSVTRRGLLKRLGLGAAVCLPLVSGVVAPTPAMAASVT